MQTMQSNLFYCKITLPVSGVTTLLMMGAVTPETCRVILQ